MALLSLDSNGLYCSAGDFYVDPVKPVKRAVVTHGHADHAHPGHENYWTSQASVPILQHRLGENIRIRGLAFGDTTWFGDVKVSLHPAGHVLGSAQVRIEHEGEVWVVSGDYKRAADPSCEPFEVVPCDHFITEATFGLPVYCWDSGKDLARAVLDWWQSHADGTSILFCYAFGKAQRILAELAVFTDRKVYLHGAMVALTALYREAGVAMLPTEAVSCVSRDYDYRGDLILAPPSAHRSPWMKRFNNMQTGFASGWMRIRGNRRRRGYERGFVLSDHADWPALIQTIRDTQAKHVWVTHGQESVLVRYLREVERLNAQPLTNLAATTGLGGGGA